MGDVADMMLDGTLCEGCGVYLHGDGNGVPRRCRDCRDDSSLPELRMKAPCPICGKRVKLAGVSDHMRDAHAQPLADGKGERG